MSARVTELEAMIERLTRQRDAQPADTVYALTHQRRIDALSVELMAWHLDSARMHAAEHAMRAAARRRRRAHAGRRRWPATAGATGLLGTLATAGQLAADTSSPPLIGGTLLSIAAVALVLTAVDRARDTREATAAEADMHAAQHQYDAVVAHHAHAIAPLPPLAVHRQETPCATPQSPAPTPATSTPPPRKTAAAASSGHRPARSGQSAAS